MKQLPAAALLLGLAVSFSAGVTLVESYRFQPSAQKLPGNTAHTPPAVAAAPVQESIAIPTPTQLPPEEFAPATSLHHRMQDKVQFDSYGNHRVETSLPGGSSRDYLLSRWPVRFPAEDELQSEHQQCGVGGYLIEYNADAVFVSITGTGSQIFTYRCSYDANRNEYALQLLQGDAGYSAAIDALLAEMSSVRR